MDKSLSHLCLRCIGQVTWPTSNQGMENRVCLWMGGFAMPCCKNVDAGRETVCSHSYHLPLHVRPLAPFSFPFLVYIIYISRLSMVLYLRCTSLVGRWSFPHHWPSAHCSHQSVNPTFSLVSPSPSDLLTRLFQIPQIRNLKSIISSPLPRPSKDLPASDFFRGISGTQLPKPPSPLSQGLANWKWMDSVSSHP